MTLNRWSPMGHGRLSHMLALSAVLGISTALAAEPQPRPSAQAALETLLQSSAGRAGEAGASGGRPVAAAALPTGGASASNGAGRAVVAVERGQGLDHLIRRHLAASPLRIELLRDLIRQLNPSAFAPGGGHRLLAGARLQLPTLDDQMRHAFGDRAAEAATATREEALPTSPGGYGHTPGARKGWVRYP